MSSIESAVWPLVKRWRQGATAAAGSVPTLWPGLVLAGVIAIAALLLSQTRGGPSMLYALLLGMALNSISADASCRPGVDFAARAVLRFGVVLLGARITVAQLGSLGLAHGLALVGAVVLTIGFGVIAARALGLSRRVGVLTGGATAICGASAAIAISSVLPKSQESERELVFTIAGVTLLSTLAMIAYPAIAHLARLDPHRTGIFLGGSIHDVAQVVGAGYSVSRDAGDTAVLAKMLRVATLLPVVTIIAAVIWRRATRSAADSSNVAPLPGFLVAFLVLVGVSSLGLLPAPAVHAMGEVSRACLLTAIAAVGLKTSLADMRQVGPRAILLMAIEAIFIAAVVLLAVRL